MRRLTDVLATGELDGYRPAPAPYEALGAPGLADATCDHCGHQGLDYRGFYRPPQQQRLGPHGWHCMAASYRPFAVCPTCGTAQEF